MSLSDKSSLSSFDFDKFSLDSGDEIDEIDEIYEIDEVDKVEKIVSVFDAENKNPVSSIKPKKNIVNIFLDMLEKNIDYSQNTNSKYLLNNFKTQIPKYIIDSRANVPCVNCANNIEQKISRSFVKILSKNYFLCYTCKDKFIAGINLLIYDKFKVMEANNEYSICTNSTEKYQKIKEQIESGKHDLNKFCYFLENNMSTSEINSITQDICNKSQLNIKYIKPYANIRIYNFDMGDFRFTNHSRINSLFKTGFIEKISDGNYKFVKEEYGKHYECKAEATNKCICCKSDLNLLKFRLEVTKYTKQFKKDMFRYENLSYLLYAVCVDCKKYCDNVQKLCVKYFVQLHNFNNFNEVVTNELNNNNASLFLKIYNNKFFELLEKK
jgi:hypothetical protein